MPTDLAGRPRRRGFTLMEIILVVVIIGILAALVGTRLVGKAQQARETAATAQIANLRTALAAFERDAGRYPTTAEGLDALVNRPGGLPADAQWERYLDERTVPADPWGRPYVYRQPGSMNPDGYDLLSRGPDGVEGTDDDIGNTR